VNDDEVKSGFSDKEGMSNYRGHRELFMGGFRP